MQCVALCPKLIATIAVQEHTIRNRAQPNVAHALQARSIQSMDPHPLVIACFAPKAHRHSLSILRPMELVKRVMQASTIPIQELVTASHARQDHLIRTRAASNVANARLAASVLLKALHPALAKYFSINLIPVNQRVDSVLCPSNSISTPLLASPRQPAQVFRLCITTCSPYCF
jgi:hypothetical protein